MPSKYLEREDAKNVLANGSPSCVRFFPFTLRQQVGNSHEEGWPTANGRSWSGGCSSYESDTLTQITNFLAKIAAKSKP